MSTKYNINLVEPSVEFLEQTDLFKHIELAGRTCYKSEDKMTETSTEKFINSIINSEHTSVLGHGTVYLTISNRGEHNDVLDILKANKYTHYTLVSKNGIDMYYITTNYRVVVENSLQDDIKKYIVHEPSKYHERRYTFRFITDIGIARDFNRHTRHSMSEESTRYCNYTNSKFGGVTFCGNVDYSVDDCIAGKHEDYMEMLDKASKKYEELIKKGAKPQQAKRVLPLATKTTLIHTAFESDWEHFINLRYYGTTGEPHPDAKVAAGRVKDILDQLNN